MALMAFLHLSPPKWINTNNSPTVRFVFVSSDRWGLTTRWLTAATKMKGREKHGDSFDEVTDLLSQDAAAA